MEKTTGQSGYSSRLFLPGQEYCCGWLSSQLHISKYHVGILKSDLQENWRQSELKDICPQKIQLLRFARTQQFPIFRLSDPVHLIWRFSFLPGSWEVRILLLREPHLENHLEERLSEPWVRQLILLSWPNCESSSTKSMLEGRGMPRNVTGDQYQIDVTRS